MTKARRTSARVLTIALTAALAGWLAPMGSQQAAAASTITVTTTADSGTGSLRAAITQANTDCAPATTACDTIDFNIASTDSGCAAATTINGMPAYVCTMYPTAGMPSITGNYVTIDGYAGNPGCPTGDSQPCGAQPNSEPLGIAGGDNAVVTIGSSPTAGRLPSLD